MLGFKKHGKKQNERKEQMMLKFILVFLLFCVLFNIVPKWKYIYIQKGTKLINEGKKEEGLKYFEMGAYGKKTDYMTKIRYAFCELKFGDIKKAKKMIMYILNEKVPLNIRYEAKSIYAIILYKEGDLEEAKEAMLSVYENYKTTNMYCTLGYLFNMLETPEKAVEFNTEAYEYNSDKDVIVDNLAQSYYLMGEYEKAEELYRDLIEKEPAFPEAYYNYGLTLAALNNKDKAKEMFEKALTKSFHNLTTVTIKEVENQLHQL